MATLWLDVLDGTVHARTAHRQQAADREARLLAGPAMAVAA